MWLWIGTLAIEAGELRIEAEKLRGVSQFLVSPLWRRHQSGTGDALMEEAR